MKTIYFVVLHYNVIAETVKCVNSILAQRNNVDNIVIKVVVVDNASPNGTGERLQKLYVNDENVKVILSKQNLGFAKGNNLGFAHAKDNSADYIVVLNNDTEIVDKNFCAKIVELSEEHGYGVLGPDIISMRDGVHQNPMKGFPATKAELQKRLLKSNIILLLTKAGLSKLLSKLSINAQQKVYDGRTNRNALTVNDSFDYILHGSCLIFSKEYIDRFDGFYPKTFMYYEEEILAYRCLKSNIKMIYDPSISINHYRNVATKGVTKNAKDALIFKEKLTIQSLRELYILLKEDRIE